MRPARAACAFSGEDARVRAPLEGGYNKSALHLKARSNVVRAANGGKSSERRSARALQTRTLQFASRVPIACDAGPREAVQ